MTVYFPSSHANELQQGVLVKIYGYCTPIGEVRNGEDGKKLDEARSGESKMEKTHPMF